MIVLNGYIPTPRCIIYLCMCMWIWVVKLLAVAILSRVHKKEGKTVSHSNAVYEVKVTRQFIALYYITVTMYSTPCYIELTLPTRDFTVCTPASAQY